jgi:chromosome segregation protein
MLKRLELVGFKSFADKTQFDFPVGVTGIVGPNGSGKSNIVDAVRWVLGEQSAKSLRGGEMTDVIFNGSASRRSLGLAEVVMTFDNSKRVLASEADEVQISRRVYRGGEGEYLINQHPCRLKDVKDLFLGSGAGSDAYCIIEQGRVEVLLQSSTRDRRIIFEEAAGVSRFRVKKTETLRRLERVDANLSRLRDILDEVDKQLRSAKLAAAKAERYQEYTARLRELRVALGLNDYRRLAADLEGESSGLVSLRTELAEQAARADAWEREINALESDLARRDEDVRIREAEAASARRDIAAAEAALNHGAALAADLEADLSRTRKRLAELSRLVADLAAAGADSAAALHEAEAAGVAARAAVDALEAEVRTAADRLAELYAAIDRDKEAHLDRMRRAALLRNDAVSYKAQVDNLTRERSRIRLRSEQAAEHLASLDVEWEELTAAETAVQQRLAAARQGGTDLRDERERLVDLQEKTASTAAELRVRRSGLASRIEILEGLERSHEGLGAGGREVFAHLEQPDPGPWRAVLGLVADFLSVRREYAPLIDLALGDRLQRFLVHDASLLEEAVRSRGRPFSGRVSFLPFELAPPSAPPASLAAVHPRTSFPSAAVVTPAAQVVRCDDLRLADLPRRLLDKTLIVRDLPTARALAGGPDGCRCVTLGGEVVEADGSLTIGVHHAETGILSRKTELRDLSEEASSLDRRLADLEGDLADLRERIALIDGRLENQLRAVEVLAEQAGDLRSRVSRHVERRAGLHEEVQVSRSELNGLDADIARLEADWTHARDQAAEAEAAVERLQSAVADAEREARAAELLRQDRQQQAGAARAASAQAEERLAGLRTAGRQLETDLHQRRLELDQVEQQIAAAHTRLVETDVARLAAAAAHADGCLQREEAEHRLALAQRERADVRLERQRRLEETQAGRSSWRARQEELTARELRVNDLNHRLTALTERLREDYAIDLAQLAGQEPQTAPPDLTNADEEIDDLRRKLSRLGGVNLDAIQELTDLETRASALQIQFDDLTAAQRSLQEIIAKINGDSRRLFMETFTTVRGHFQELFRKLFGGGMADVVLEDESDVLESGIDIIARPPGKELRGISLMSGGEKTMTAVALLLAIFRSKPSPFCILDEVDAALDEANVGRFTAVLREFLDRSQFILITHSKRTMACADVLYGITMQESGISRRIAVKFEDWPDDDRKESLSQSA